MIESPWFHNATTGAAAAILVCAIGFGVFKGIDDAKSAVTLKQVAVLQEGLSYFNQDQGRYPTTLEFADTNIMKAYFNNFPARDILSSSCSKPTISYNSAYASTYELRFCLAAPQGQFNLGFNSLNP